MAQSFGKTFSDKEVERYINPNSFMSEIDMEEYEETTPGELSSAFHFFWLHVILIYQ